MTNPERVLVLIPARMASTRLPGKMMADIGGMPLIARVYQQVATLSGYKTIVAADHSDIVAAVEGVGGRAIMTDSALASGSDRIAAALEQVDPERTLYDVVVNFQGDAVNTDPRIVVSLVEMLDRRAADIATCCMEMAPGVRGDPSAVKIAIGLEGDEREGRCLYFSRAAIPFDRDGVERTLYHHIGIYLYRREALEQFVRCPQGVLERRESLEQLRALEQGMVIWGRLIDELVLHQGGPADVDTAGDLEGVRRVFVG